MKNVDEFKTEQGGGGASFLAHIPAILWQRRWWIVLPLVLLSIAGVVTAFLLPVRYTSTAKLLVQSASLPQAIAQGNPDDVIDRRIARISEQVLSRPQLIELVNRYQLYPRERARAAHVADHVGQRGARPLARVELVPVDQLDQLRPAQHLLADARDAAVDDVVGAALRNRLRQ